MAGRKKQEDKHLTILRDLVQQPNNKKCFDCGQRGPTYVNMTIGAYVCTTCSGMLRGLNPPHRIKSISMATFNAQEMDFLQKHGNEVCRSTWLAEWSSHLPPEPESREEQKMKDFLIRKYERKMWYSSQPKAKPAEEPAPEAKPLKALLGENAPRVHVNNSPREQKAATISPPAPNAIRLPAVQPPRPSPPARPPQPVATQPPAAVPAPTPAAQPTSAFDLLGDLGSDPFASSAPAPAPQATFAADFSQPPAQASPVQPAFDAFGSTASAPRVQPQAPGQFGQFDFFANNGDSNPPPPANAGSTDKYAAFADLTSLSSDSTQSIFSASANPGPGPGPQTNQPNPFMSPASGASGAAVFQQQQQKPVNPFQTSTPAVPASSAANGNIFGQMTNFPASQPMPQQQAMPQQQQQQQPQSGWGTFPASSANSSGFPPMGMPQNMPNSQQGNLSFGGAGNAAMAANQFRMNQPSNQMAGPFGNMPQQQNNQGGAFGGMPQQQGFRQQQQQPQQQQQLFNQQQQQQQQQGFPQQAFGQQQSQFPPQQNFGQPQQGFPQQQNMAGFGGMNGAFPTQQPAAAAPNQFGGNIFGSNPMPQKQAPPQTQSQFGGWGQSAGGFFNQPQQPTNNVSKSTNPFM